MSELDDAKLERQIRIALAAYETARSKGHFADAKEFWHEFVNLIAQRSPRQVAKMEKRAGLADA